MKKILLCIAVFAFSPSVRGGAERAVGAVDAADGQAIPLEKVIQSPKNLTRHIVDERNLRIELGNSASCYFDSQGIFHLLRGSAILESTENRELITVNGHASFAGKIIVSYDYHEQSSSLFVVFGKAQFENSANANSKKNLTRNEGATLVTGEYYPSLMRNLDFDTADGWLERFGWSEDKRKELLANVPTAKTARTLASTDENSPQRQEAVKKELLSYFPVEQADKGPKKYENEFTTSSLHGKGFSTVEDQLNRGEEIEIITPEQAAVIVLPEIDLGTGIHVSAQKEEAARNSRAQEQKRKPASLTRVKQFTPPSEKLPEMAKLQPTQSSSEPAKNAGATNAPVLSALDRLNQLEASQPDSVKKDPGAGDPLELRENF